MNTLQRTGLVACACVLAGLYAAPASAGPPSPGPCGGLTAAQAATILHISPTEVRGPRVTRVVELEAAHNCRYRDSKNLFKNVSFDLSVEKSAAAAERSMNVEKQNFAGVASAVAVKNLGDEAWRYTWRGFGPPPRLLMRKGNVWLDVHQPEDEASQKQIAEIVLRHISPKH